MSEDIKTKVFLLADDDEDYYAILKNAFKHLKSPCDLRWVRDGGELLEYLHRRNGYANPALSPRPDLILLDINMPKKSGLEALQEIRATAGMNYLPVVMLTASNDQHDVLASYQAGASSFITKPLNFQDLLSVIQILTDYWQKAVTLPR